MFCNEPILKIHELILQENLRPERSDALFQITNCFEYHTTFGYWYLLETENFYITVGYGGVIKYKKPYEFSQEEFIISTTEKDDAPMYEDLIFTGQRICAVEKQGDYTLISLDDFSWKLYVYDENDDKWFENCSYGSGDEIVPVGVHLLKNCSCGGKPEIYIDHVDDFFIRCGSCHSATYSNMLFKKCMDDWNMGNTPITLSTTKEYFEKAVSTQKIKRIVVESDGLEMLDEGSCRADGIIVEFENTMISLRNTRLGEDSSKFVFGMPLARYNKNLYSFTIYPTVGELKFLHYDKIYGDEEMVFVLDDTKLNILTDGIQLFLSLAEPHENNFVVAKRSKLFCESNPK